MGKQSYMKDNYDTNPGGYALIAADLSGRNDYIRPKRYKIYKISYESQLDRSQAPTGNLNDLLKYVLFYDGDGYLPVYEYDDKGIFLEETNRLFEENKIDFALISIEGETNLLHKIILYEIPFAIVCPKEVKCEWLKIASDRDAEREGVSIFCENYKCNRKCEDHDELFNNNDRIKKNLELFKTEFPRLMEDHYIKKIPVFQYSTSIDIIRWYHFYKKYSTKPIPITKGNDRVPIIKGNDRDLAFRENILVALTQLDKQLKHLKRRIKDKQLDV